MKKHLNSKEKMKELKVSACTLSHLRKDGKLKFIKKGNAFYYEQESIEIIKERKKLNKM